MELTVETLSRPLRTPFLAGHGTSLTAICRVLGRYKMYVDCNDVGLSGHLLIDG